MTNTLNTHTLSNGLRVIHYPTSSPVAYCGFAVDAGTRDEAPNGQGMAHFVEHLIFKGTSKRHAWHILNRMENVGGDLNAFTNKEETIIYSAFLCEHFTRATELLTDIVFHSTFPQHEIEKEVEVIVEEIESYEDSPSELIFDDFEELLFPTHPLGRNILGRPEQLRTYKSADALRFTQCYYVPQNMVFFVYGNVAFKKTVRTLEATLSDLSATASTTKRQPPLPYTPRRVVTHRDTHQAHVMMGCRGYDAHDCRRTPLYLLNNILGGPGMNSWLNVSLREKRGLVYNVEANLNAYTDTGVFSIYFGCDTRDIDRCIALVHKELQRLREKPLSDIRLRAAKKQIIGQIGVAGDNTENIALDMGKTFLHYGRYDSQTEVFQRINNITSQQLWEVSNELLTPDNLSTLIYR